MLTVILIHSKGLSNKFHVIIDDLGPKKITENDMWKMVWHTQANRIVMVTNLKEAGKVYQTIDNVILWFVRL